MKHPARLVLTGSIQPAWRPQHRHGQTIARWIVAIAIAAAGAWFVSEIAVAALLDESRLAILGIVAS